MDKLDENKLEDGSDSRTEPEGQNQEEETALSSEILGTMPPESRGRVTRSFSSITQFASPVFNPVLQRITSEHISQVISNAAAQSNREAEAEKSNRRYQFSYFVVTIVALLSLLVFFAIREQYNVLIPVVTGITGLGSGFGIGKFTNRR